MNRPWFHLYYRAPYKRCLHWQILRSDTEKIVGYALTQEIAEMMCAQDTRQTGGEEQCK